MRIVTKYIQFKVKYKISLNHIRTGPIIYIIQTRRIFQSAPLFLFRTQIQIELLMNIPE